MTLASDQNNSYFMTGIHKVNSAKHWVVCLITMLAVLLCVTQASADFLPGARIKYKNLDGMPVGICDPMADELTDQDREHGQRSATNTNVAQSCVMQHIALKQECDPTITKAEDDPYRRHVQDELGYNEDGDLIMRRGTYDVILPDMLLDVPAPGADVPSNDIVDPIIPETGRVLIAFGKEGNDYRVRMFNAESEKVVDQLLGNFQNDASLDEHQKEALVSVRSILQNWETHPTKRKSEFLENLTLLKRGVLTVSNQAEKGDIFYNRDGSAQSNPKGKRSCAALDIIPSQPFKVGVEFFPVMPKTQEDGSPWPKLIKRVEGEPALPEKFLPDMNNKPGAPIYDYLGKKIINLEELDFSNGIGKPIWDLTAHPIYTSVDLLTYTGKRVVNHAQEELGCNEQGEWVLRNKFSPVYQKVKDGQCVTPAQLVMEDYVLEKRYCGEPTKGLDETCQNEIEYKQGQIIYEKVNGVCQTRKYQVNEPILDSECKQQLIYGEEILAVVNAGKTTEVAGGLYARIFSDLPLHLQEQILKLKSETVDIEVGDTQRIHPSTGISFEVKLEAGKACVYAHDANNPDKEWRVKHDFPITEADVYQQVSLDKKSCTGENRCVNNRCVAPESGTFYPGIGETCFEGVSYENSMADQSEEHCVPAPPHMVEYRSLVWGSIIDRVCSTYDLPEAQADYKFTSVVVTCIERSMMNLFFPPGDQKSFFRGVQDAFKAVIRAALAIYIVFIGFRLFGGQKALPDKKDRMWYLLKIALVIYFAMGTGMEFVLPKLVNISKSLSVLVMEASLGMAPDPAIRDLQSEANAQKHTLRQLQIEYEDKQLEYNGIRAALERNDTYLEQKQEELNDLEAQLAALTNQEVQYNRERTDAPLAAGQETYLSAAHTIMACSNVACITQAGCVSPTQSFEKPDYTKAKEWCRAVLGNQTMPTLQQQLTKARAVAQVRTSEVGQAQAVYESAVAAGVAQGKSPQNPTYDDLKTLANQNDPIVLAIIKAREALYSAMVASWNAGNRFENGINSFTFHGKPPVTIPAITAVENISSPIAILQKQLADLDETIQSSNATKREVEAALDALLLEKAALDELLEGADLAAMETQVNEAKQAFDNQQIVYDEKNTAYSSALATTVYDDQRLGYSYCDFRMYDYPPELVTLKLWDMVDCKISTYLGLGRSVERPGVPQLLLYGCLAIISTAYGIPIFLISFILLIFVITVTYRIVHIYIMAFISLILLVFISPVVIPAVLFEQLKPMFNKWLTLLTSYIFQPVILFAFLSFIFAVFDIVFFGDNENFNSKQFILSKDVQVVASSQECQGNLVINAKGIACPDFVINAALCPDPTSNVAPVYCADVAREPSDCQDDDALGCLYQTVREDVTHIDYLDWDIHKIDFRGDQDEAMMFGLLKMLLITFIGFYILELVTDLAMRLTSGFDGGAAGISSMPVLNTAQSINLIGQVAYGAQKTALTVGIGAGKLGIMAGGAVAKQARLLPQDLRDIRDDMKRMKDITTGRRD